MRGSVDGLGSSAPIGTMLPAVFADDDLAQRFVCGLDDVIAPILSVLDCLDTYFRPVPRPTRLHPVAGELGRRGDRRATNPKHACGQPWPPPRTCTASAAPGAGCPRRSGSRSAVEPEITESGGAAWNARPLGPFPGDPRPRLHVHLRLPAPTPADHYRLETLVSAARPAHMPYTVQVTAGAPAERTRET